MFLLLNVNVVIIKCQCYYYSMLFLLNNALLSGKLEPFSFKIIENQWGGQQSYINNEKVGSERQRQ